MDGCYLKRHSFDDHERFPKVMPVGIYWPGSDKYAMPFACIYLWVCSILRRISQEPALSKTLRHLLQRKSLRRVCLLDGDSSFLSLHTRHLACLSTAGGVSL